MKKVILYSLGAVVVLLASAVAGWWYYYQSLYNEYKGESVEQHQAASDSLSTNSIATFSDQEMSMYGKWSDQSEELNYTVFMLDDAGDGFYWGKEWCEQDNVFESDLEDHGSGWFKWRVKKDKLLLLHTSNFGFVVPVEYTITQLEDTMMGMKSQFNRRPKSFSRAYN